MDEAERLIAGRSESPQRSRGKRADLLQESTVVSADADLTVCVRNFCSRGFDAVSDCWCGVPSARRSATYGALRDAMVQQCAGQDGHYKKSSFPRKASRLSHALFCCTGCRRSLGVAAPLANRVVRARSSAHRRDARRLSRVLHEQTSTAAPTRTSGQGASGDGRAELSGASGSPRPRDRGLSMVGYGALRLALGFPGTFTVQQSQRRLDARASDYRDLNADEMKRVFGARPAGSEHDL